MSKSHTAPSSRLKGKNVVMASYGRAPWYTPDGRNVDSYVIGIAGGSASGKTSVARSILTALGYVPSVLILSQDAFYCAHSPEEIELAFNNDLDLDHPDSIDMPLFAKCLDDLKQGRATEIPVYSFVHHQRMPEKKYLYGASVIIVEGIMALQSKELRDLYDLKVFVNCDADLMLARRIKRDVKERGRDVDGILDQYLRFVKNSYDNFVQPSSKFADMIVPGSSNQVAIDLLVTHIKRQIDARSLRFRNRLARQAQAASDCADQQVSHDATEINAGVILLDQTPQLHGIMTILRNRLTERGDFIFYADRLATLIVEKALGVLPYRSRAVSTPIGSLYAGQTRLPAPLVGMPILRSGGPFVHGLRRVIRDVQIGSMLIQSDPKTGEPLLLHLKIPDCIRSQATSVTARVLLLDSQMGTGAAAMMAIRVLLDHGVLATNIIFLAFLVSRHGVASIRRAFPDVQIVTAAIDSDLHEMHLPLTSLIMGRSAGEADFAARLVSEAAGLLDSENPSATDTFHVESRSAGPIAQRSSALELETKSLEFSRRKDDKQELLEKRAWVISPGMGHIGDRYYTS